jgi:hypothetical protein
MTAHAICQILSICGTLRMDGVLVTTHSASFWTPGQDYQIGLTIGLTIADQPDLQRRVLFVEITLIIADNKRDKVQP